jgi:hypothetical protein
VRESVFVMVREREREREALKRQKVWNLPFSETFFKFLEKLALWRCRPEFSRHFHFKAIFLSTLTANRTVGTFFFAMQGCQIFHATKHQNGKKYTELPQNIPNVHKIYQKTVKRTKRP